MRVLRTITIAVLCTVGAAFGLLLIVTFWPLPDGFWYTVLGFGFLFAMNHMQQERDALRKKRHQDIMQRLDHIDLQLRLAEQERRRIKGLLDRIVYDLEQAGITTP